MTDTSAGGAVAIGGTVRAPSPERRAAAAMHSVRHSIGLVLVTVDPGHGEFSFRVAEDGAVVELAGWGFAGPVPEVPNPPPNPLAVHTVLLPEYLTFLPAGVDDPEVDAAVAAITGGIRSLIDGHIERYSSCQIFPAPGLPRPLDAWVRTGCPEPWLLDSSIDEALATPTVGSHLRLPAGGQ